MMQNHYFVPRMFIRPQVLVCRFLRIALAVALAPLLVSSDSSAAESTGLADGAVVKAILKAEDAGENLLKAERWRPWSLGFELRNGEWLCDNGEDRTAQRGASQTLTLNQRQPEPIVASVWSKAAGVTGSADSDYALYLDLVYEDGTPLWGQTAAFATGTHDWQRREVIVLPAKPVRSVTVNLLLRRHGGQAWFRAPELRVVRTPDGAGLFDGVPVVPRGPSAEGFQVRDVAAGSDFVRLEREALGLKLTATSTERAEAQLIDITLTDTTGKDRAVTLLYTIPVPAAGLQWLQDPRHSVAVSPRREYLDAGHFRAGANGRLSRYPLAAVADPSAGVALGIDMARPAFYRLGYNAATAELFLAYDLALTGEKPSVQLRCCRYAFSPQWGFRAALDRYYAAFPEAFVCRTPQQGLWMPFAKISRVQGWEDFGFRFKEGNDETQWDDQQGILTFRYTEPMTWWMALPKDRPRTLEAALAEAKRLARENGDPHAQALLTSGYEDECGHVPARLLDTPWCNGAVWSMNSMPGIVGEVTDFKNKWNGRLREQLYGPQAKGDLDGEYIDSSEGYVTDELDFRRDHFAAADTPLTFSLDTRQPAIFRGLVTFEYVRAIAQDVHARGKWMMANGAPTQLCWLAPLLEVMGTETDWHRGKWTPMSDAELLYRRALCKGKPYCFLMNTKFEEFPYELVERYMRRALAYGMFPGFFSHNASEGQYFNRPDLYNRDRPLFQRYLPLCKRVAEAGWEPITGACCDDPHVYLERFGSRYLTVFNDSAERRTVTIQIDRQPPVASRELLSGQSLPWQQQKLQLSLDGEDVRVLDLTP
jgi:hypothetical protein